MIRVVAAVVVVRTNGGEERYVSEGALLPVEALDADNLEHLLSVGLVERVPEPEPEQKEAEPAPEPAPEPEPEPEPKKTGTRK